MDYGISLNTWRQFFDGLIDKIYRKQKIKPEPHTNLYPTMFYTDQEFFN